MPGVYLMKKISNLLITAIAVICCGFSNAVSDICELRNDLDKIIEDTDSILKDKFSTGDISRILSWLDADTPSHVNNQRTLITIATYQHKYRLQYNSNISANNVTMKLSEEPHRQLSDTLQHIIKERHITMMALSRRFDSSLIRRILQYTWNGSSTLPKDLDAWHFLLYEEEIKKEEIKIAKEIRERLPDAWRTYNCILACYDGILALIRRPIIIRLAKEIRERFPDAWRTYSWNWYNYILALIRGHTVIRPHHDAIRCVSHKVIFSVLPEHFMDYRDAVTYRNGGNVTYPIRWISNAEILSRDTIPDFAKSDDEWGVGVMISL